MSILENIKDSQKQWANENNIPLQGSEREKGDKIYTMDLNSNFFIPLSDNSYMELKKGKGNELISINNREPTAQALHSSCALVVNIFEYWKQNKEYSIIAKLLGINDKNIINMEYEKPFTIFNKTNIQANLDVCFEYSDNSVVAIESKYTEPYGLRNGKNIFKLKYFDINNKDIWCELPNLFELANMINNNETVFEYLDASQLIKHTLGLQNIIKNKGKYELIYLYFPSIEKTPEVKHEIEIMALNEIMKLDKINFVCLNWLNVIEKLRRNLHDVRKKYIEYIVGRYVNSLLFDKGKIKFTNIAGILNNIDNIKVINSEDIKNAQTAHNKR